jgi:carbon starvation protein
MAWMYGMSVWALVAIVRNAFKGPEGLRLSADPVAWVGLVLIALAVWMLAEAVRAVARPAGPPAPPASSGELPAPAC